MLEIGRGYEKEVLLAAFEKYGIIRKSIAGKRIIPEGFWRDGVEEVFPCPRPLVNHTGDF